MWVYQQTAADQEFTGHPWVSRTLAAGISG